MGFSSFTCAQTNLPIMNCTSGKDGRQFDVVLTDAKGRGIARGIYDGYGKILIGETDPIVLYESDYWSGLETGKYKLVLAAAFKPGEPVTGQSRRELGQGHFYEPSAVADLYSEVLDRGRKLTYDDYVKWAEAHLV